MIPRGLVLLTLAALVASCEQLPPERRIIADAAAALGGADQIQATETLVLVGEGQNFNLGQNPTPDSPLPEFDITGHTLALDFANDRWRLEQVRTAQFLTGNPTTRQIRSVDGDVAFDVAMNGAVTRTSDAEAGRRREALLHHPVGILRAAQGEGAQVGDYSETAETASVVVTTPAGSRATLHVDRASGLPARVVSRQAHAVLGDIDLETEFLDYAPAAGLTLPTRLITRVDGHVVADITVSNEVNGTVGNLAVPPPVLASPPAVNEPIVEVQELAEGVWYLAGQSHHSVAVEFADHLMLIEAPLNDARTLAVIERARTLRPEKPVTQVVMTHHHFDHAGGVRAAVSEGLTIVAHGGNREFLQDLAAREHTIEPDALSASPGAPSIEVVDGERTFEDDTRTLTLYAIEGSAHCGTCLMAYLPEEGLLVEADLYSPPPPGTETPPAAPHAAVLLQNIRDRGLDVQSIVPIHGRVVPFGDLVALVQPAETTD